MHGVFIQIKQKSVRFDFFQSNSPDTKTPIVNWLKLPRLFEIIPFILLLIFEKKKKNHAFFPCDIKITVVVFHIVLIENEF